MPRLLAFVLLLAVLAPGPATTAQVAPALRAPRSAPAALAAATSALRFAVIGDNGTGKTPQYEVARQMAASRQQFPYDLVLMVGDNLYKRPSAKAFAEAFAEPYGALLSGGVRFYAVLGNHDDPETRTYPAWNMGGRRYYTHARGNVRFFALDTNVLDDAQMAWFEAALKQSPEPWKVVYFHHPLYSNGTRHGSNVELRVRLEPLLVRYGVNVVFSGHDHIYERWKPQKGITYFVTGASGKLREGVRPSNQTAAAFDQDQTFVLVEITDDALSFRALSRTGRVVDSGVIFRQPMT